MLAFTNWGGSVRPLTPSAWPTPGVARSGTASRRSMGILTFGDKEDGTDNNEVATVSGRRRRDLSVSVTAGETVYGR